MKVKEILEGLHFYNDEYEMHPYGRHIKRGDTVRIKGDASGKTYKVVAIDASKIGLDNGDIIDEYKVEPITRKYRDASKS